MQTFSFTLYSKYWPQDKQTDEALTAAIDGLLAADQIAYTTMTVERLASRILVTVHQATSVKSDLDHAAVAAALGVG